MFKIFGGIAAAATVSACGTVHDAGLPDVTKDAVQAADVLYSFECELVDALAGKSAGQSGPVPAILKNKAVRVAFSLTVSEARSIGPSLSLAVPSGPTVVSLGANLTPTTKASRTSDFRLSYNTQRLNTCTAEIEAEKGLTRIQAGLGLADWARQIAAIEEKIDNKIELESYTFQFDIGAGAGSSATRTQTSSNGNVSSFAFMPALSKASSHKIVVTFEELKKPVPKTAESPIPAVVKDRLDDVLDRVLERAFQ